MNCSGVPDGWKLVTNPYTLEATMKLTAERVHGGHIHVKADGALIGDLMPFSDQVAAVVEAINLADAAAGLLAACKEAYGCLPSIDLSSPLGIQLKSAIAKAEGE